MNGDVKEGNKVTVKVQKNKVGRPFTKAVFDVLYGVGIDKIGELIRLGKELDILKVRAEVITYGDQKYKEDEFRALLIDNEEFNTKIRNEILELLKGIAPVEEVPE